MDNTVITEDELLELEEITTLEEVNVLTDHLAKTNNKIYNKTKFLEELAELSEVILKHINKHPKHKPEISAITEELGDVLFRFTIYSKSEGISQDSITNRITKKANICLQNLKQGNYVNGV